MPLGIPDAVTFARALNILNALDALGTLTTVCLLGLTNEANPLMAWLIGVNPILFAVVKLTGVGICATVLALHDRRAALAVCCVFYTLALATHARLILGS